MLGGMRERRREVIVIAIAIAVATAAGILVAAGAVRPPAAMCITPYGNAVSAPGCDVNNVSATLAVVAGALTAIVAGLLTLAAESCALAVWSRRHLPSAEIDHSLSA
jgi:hypothetical protein